MNISTLLIFLRMLSNAETTQEVLSWEESAKLLYLLNNLEVHEGHKLVECFASSTVGKKLSWDEPTWRDVQRKYQSYGDGVCKERSNELVAAQNEYYGYETKIFQRHPGATGSWPLLRFEKNGRVTVLHLHGSLVGDE